MTHWWIDSVDARGTTTRRGGLDKALTGAQRFTIYRVRFQLLNDGDEPVTLSPGLEVSKGSAWTLVPETDPVDGIAFYAASDDGRRFIARRTSISPDGFRLATSDDPLGIPVAGASSAGPNPLPDLTLPAHGFTEVEFAVRATVDAHWGAPYDFRLARTGAPVVEDGPASILMGAKPSLGLSPGQRRGTAVDDPLPLYPLDASAALGASALTGPGMAASYPLAPRAAAPTSFVSPHTTYSLTSDSCAACHSSHDAQGALLLAAPAPVSGLCFRCHDGTGASSDVEADFASPTLPANDPATGSWYSHPATAAIELTTTDDPFAGTLYRRALCTDCHQPHLADATRPVMTTGGWTSGGAIGGAPGVAVTNGPAGSSPAYALTRTASLEYQVCFRCHSGYTELPARDPAHPSRWALDKAVELNPANVSYHPVEAAGKNQTRAMAMSLSGSSPYKLWSLATDSTVRCQHCHGDSDVANPASPPSADAVLDNHAGPNRGLLIAPYRDRDLLGNLEPYDAADFALCYTCHAEPPMVDGTGDPRTDTNFSAHGLHLNEIWLNGTGGLDIDVAGSGQGNAICAECHFRIHGTALAVNGQAPAKALVNFAPNVQPLNGTLRFVPWSGSTPGSCTLTCHGRAHNAFTYEGAP